MGGGKVWLKFQELLVKIGGWAFVGCIIRLLRGKRWRNLGLNGIARISVAKGYWI